MVSGAGLNVSLPANFDLGAESGRAQPVRDLAGLCRDLPSAGTIAASLIDGLCGVFINYEARGFAAYMDRWRERDWLRGRKLTIDTPRQPLSGVAAGVADDGALLVEVDDGEVQRVTSGTVVVAGARGATP